MSYQDIVHSGTARELRPYGGSPESQADKAAKDLIARVFRLQTEVSRLRADVNRLGGPRDTVELRHKVGGATVRLQEDAKSIKEALTAVHSQQKSTQTSKILVDFEAVLKDFQATMKAAKAKEAASLPVRPQLPRQAVPLPEDLESGGGGGPPDAVERAALLQEQQRVELGQMDNEISYNEALIDERDAGIAEISQQIGEVNEIFQDLAVLVNDQGVMLDDIEANIERTADRTRTAGGELVRAERLQRSSRNRMCYILLVVAAVLAVLVIVFSI